MTSLSLIFLFIVCLTSGDLSAYVRNFNSFGDPIYWKDRVIYINVMSENSDNIDKSTLYSIVQESSNRWESDANININIHLNDSIKIGRNDIYFNSNVDIGYMGSGVVGVTQLIYEDDVGHIREADIILNDLNFNFSLDNNSDYYLGNIITHEMGHLLGLSHSEIKSTMFYKIFKGQYNLFADDKAGIYSIYPIINSETKNYARIIGNLVGGDLLLGIFGANVIAISVTTGEQVSVLSTSDGAFVIEGLDNSDKYYIYTSPIINKDVLPDYYRSARSDFCEDHNNFQGSFFSTCFSEDVGVPQLIDIRQYATIIRDQASLDIGNITVRCDFPVSPKLLDDNLLDDHEFEGLYNRYETAVTGIFTKFQIDNRVADIIKVNLEHYEIHDDSYYLDIRLISDSLHSPLQSTVKVFRSSDNNLIAENDTNDLEWHLYIPLSQGVAFNNDNIFNIELTPKSFADFRYSDYLDNGSYLNILPFYMLSMRLLRKDVDGNFYVAGTGENKIVDNYYCPDALNTYKVSPMVSKRVTLDPTIPRIMDGDSHFAVGCGLIHDHNRDNDGSGLSGGGGVSSYLFLFSLLLGIFFVYLPNKLLQV